MGVSWSVGAAQLRVHARDACHESLAAGCGCVPAPHSARTWRTRHAWVAGMHQDRTHICTLNITEPRVPSSPTWPRRSSPDQPTHCAPRHTRRVAIDAVGLHAAGVHQLAHVFGANDVLVGAAPHLQVGRGSGGRGLSGVRVCASSPVLLPNGQQTWQPWGAAGRAHARPRAARNRPPVHVHALAAAPAAECAGPAAQRQRMKRTRTPHLARPRQSTPPGRHHQLLCGGGHGRALAQGCVPVARGRLCVQTRLDTEPATRASMIMSGAMHGAMHACSMHAACAGGACRSSSQALQ